MIEQDTHNGYGFYCDLEGDIDEYYDETEKSKIHSIPIEKYPISFFLTMILEHPERYLIVCIGSCLTTCLFCYWCDRPVPIYEKNY